MPKPADPPAHGLHDAFFRATFSDPAVAREFLRAYLPARLAEAITWPTLERVPGSFVDAHLAGRCADLLYRAQCGGRAVYLYCLFEHQSTVDPDMPLRLLVYMVRLWEQDRKEFGPGRKLPPIVPLVLHQGPGAWTVSPQFLDLMDWPAEVRAELEPFQPRFAHALVDLGRMPLAEIRARLSVRLVRALVGLLKAARAGRTAEWLFEEVAYLVELMAQPDRAAVARTMLSYWFEVEEGGLSTFRQAVAQLEPANVREGFMSLAEQLKAEGRQEGRQEGRLIGRIQTLQEVLRRPVSAAEELAQQPTERLKELLRQLEAQIP